MARNDWCTPFGRWATSCARARRGKRSATARVSRAASVEYASRITTDLSKSTAETVDRFNTAFNSHDVDAIMALMTDDCVFEDTEPPPDGGRYEGQAAVRQCWVDLFAGAPSAVFTAEEIFVAEDRAVVRWLYRWAPDTAAASGHIRGVDIMR